MSANVYIIFIHGIMKDWTNKLKHVVYQKLQQVQVSEDTLAYDIVILAEKDNLPNNLLDPDQLPNNRSSGSGTESAEMDRHNHEKVYKFSFLSNIEESEKKVRNANKNRRISKTTKYFMSLRIYLLVKDEYQEKFESCCDHTHSYVGCGGFDSTREFPQNSTNSVVTCPQDPGSTQL